MLSILADALMLAVRPGTTGVPSLDRRSGLELLEKVNRALRSAKAKTGK